MPDVSSLSLPTNKKEKRKKSNLLSLLHRLLHSRSLPFHKHESRSKIANDDALGYGAHDETGQADCQAHN
jgi:hypothetical protein